MYIHVLLCMAVTPSNKMWQTILIHLYPQLIRDKNAQYSTKKQSMCKLWTYFYSRIALIASVNAIFFNMWHYFSTIIYKWQDVYYAYLFLMYMVSGCTGPSIKSSSTPWRHHWWLQTSSASHSPLKAFIGSGGVIMPAPDICSCMAFVWSAAVNKEDG